MSEKNDMELLREYARSNSEPAFAELVRRHINMVHSVALRYSGNPQDAQDVTQAVFVILAKKAGNLREKIILAGWLYETTRFTATTLLRAQIRRQSREQEAYMQSTLNESDADSVWQHVAPLLEAAMTQLSEKDRTLLALHFFENKNGSEIASLLGIEEWAARKRVARAVEKLRTFFARRGVGISAVALVAAVSANSVQAAPAVLVTTVTTTALTTGAAASASTSALIKGTLKLMAWTKIKPAIVIGVGILLAAGTTTITVGQIQKDKTYSWEVPTASFPLLYKTPPQVVIVPTKFANLKSPRNGAWVYSASTGTMGIAQPVEEIVLAAYGKDRLRTIFTSELPQGKYDYFAKLTTTEEPNPHWAEALQTELKTKLGVVGKLEMRETDVWSLRFKNSNATGFKLPGKINFPRGTHVDVPPSSLPSLLPSYLEGSLEIPALVIDQMETTNHSDFTPKWDRAGTKKHANLDELNQAFLDDLGLEIVPGRAMIEMLIVDRVKN